jgi:hypothetical protein
VPYKGESTLSSSIIDRLGRVLPKEARLKSVILFLLTTKSAASSIVLLEVYGNLWEQEIRIEPQEHAANYSKVFGDPHPDVERK